MAFALIKIMKQISIFVYKQVSHIDQLLTTTSLSQHLTNAPSAALTWYHYGYNKINGQKLKMKIVI